MSGMRDVAKKAGVSLSTVSLVVNQTGYVSDEMRERVGAAMKELDYIPNELARNLYRNRTNTVGVIVPTIRHPFFATLTAALQREFSKRGMRTMLCSTVDADSGEAEYVDMLRRRMMDGLVVASHTTHAPEYWESVGRSIVAFDRYLGEGIPSIGSDHVQGGRLIAERLIATGARHVVMIGGPREQFHDRAGGAGTTFPTIRYYLTLEHELAQRGIAYDYVEAGEVYNFDGYESAVHDAFERYAGMDAVVCSDIGAACCVQEAARRGIAIPRDLQVIAYDGTYLTDIAGMRLTAVCQDFDGLSAAVVSHMMTAIEGAGHADGDGVAGVAGVAKSDGAVGGAGAAAAGTAGAGAGTAGVNGTVGVAGVNDAAGVAGPAEAASVFVPVTLRSGETTR